MAPAFMDSDVIAKLQAKLRLLLTIDRPPWVIATACAVGMLIGISPYVGFHTLIAIGLSVLFRLPAYPLILGAYITNPFTIPFIYALTTKFGMWLLGNDTTIVIDWNTFGLDSLFSTAKSLMWPFIIGTHVAGAVLSVFTYVITYYIVKKYKNNK